MSRPKIAVIGAGPAGCMLARLLQRGQVDVTIFESDSAPNFRSQGGTLDLHTDTGLAAMKEAGLWDEFQKNGRYDGQYLAIVDKDLRYYFVREAESSSDPLGERPEIDRPVLREILADSLNEGTIRWGHHVQRVEGRMIIFQDGSTASGYDLIVGADGAWSKVRAFLAPDSRPQFLGVGMYELVIPDAEKNSPETVKLVNHGSIYGTDEGKRLSIQAMGNGSIHMYANFVRSSPDWMSPVNCPYDSHNIDQVRAALLEEYADWKPEFRHAVERIQIAIPRSLFVYPPGARWEHKPGFTLIGDAAHLMTPFAGEGVNQAFDGAKELAKVILHAAKNGTDVNDGIELFETQMMGRAQNIQQLSYDLAQAWLFTSGGARATIIKATGTHFKQEIPALFHPFVPFMIKSWLYFKGVGKH